MSAEPTPRNAPRDYVFNVRLSPAERAQLATLAQHFGVDQSAAMRHLLQQAARTWCPFPDQGRFTPIGLASTQQPFEIHLKRLRKTS